MPLDQLSRQHFLAMMLGPAMAGARPAGQVRITSVTLAPLQGRFHKFVSMNSYDTAPKGHTYEGTLVRIATDQGVEGVGTMAYRRPDDVFLTAVRRLVGVDPLRLYRTEGGKIVGRSAEFASLLEGYKHLDGPLFDLIGKLKGKPCWQLIGDPVRARVEVYDGTLYFSDVWFSDRGVRAAIEEAIEARRKGYLGMKFKVGRGWKWMEPEAGLRRDVEVLVRARKELGGDVRILADANNGYRNDIERAWRLIEDSRDAGLYWMEELFPEDPGKYRELRRRLQGSETLIADGENFRESAQFDRYLRPERLIDVLQLDVRRGGFLGCMEMARKGAAVGAVTVPHNWGSQVGLFMGLHLAKAVKSIIAAEDDRSTCDVIEADGYAFEKGHYTVSNAPGLGISVNKEVYAKKCKAREIVLD